LTERYDRWTSASRHPGLVRDFLAARVTAPGDVRLFRFDQESRILQPVEWPPEFAAFHENAVGESVGQRPPAGPGRGMERPDLQHIPAMANPVMQPQRPPQFGGRGFGGPRPPFMLRGWEIIRLDDTYLSAVFFPFLIERHFAKQGDFDYDILVAQSETGRVLYSTSPGATLADFQNADATVRLSPMGFGGPPPGRGRGGGPPPPPLSGWELYARHHSGSLQSFANQFRQRNLAISFGIFAILAIGIAFTVLSSERVRAMGKLQLEFAAGLSHELRTPLTVIRSAGYNLASGKVAEAGDVVRYGNVLQEQGLRLSDMVEQALLFAQTQSGRNRYQRNPVDVAEVIRRAIQSCDAMRPKYPSEIAAEVDPNLPLALTDADAIHHCLHNLLVNALKYGTTPAQIRVTAAADLTGREPQIAIAVENRGTPVNPADLPHLFDPFFRGKNTDGVPGSGLGLYIVKSIMESLGGRVTVSSLDAGGTRFTLHVPAIV
jgi:signal transduction histidine kinase